MIQRKWRYRWDSKIKREKFIQSGDFVDKLIYKKSIFAVKFVSISFMLLILLGLSYTII